MCPASRAPNYDVWSNAEPTIDVDVLMPNGILITVNVMKEITFFEIKELVHKIIFEEKCQKEPLFGALHDKQTYVFTYVDMSSSEQQELDDEEVRLCDVCPFLALLRLIEKKGDKAALQLDAQIGLLIGKNLKEFDSLKNPEVNDFRFKMRTYAEEVAQQREQKTWIEKMIYQFPIGIDFSRELPVYLKERLNKCSDIAIKLRFENSSLCQDLYIKYDSQPEEIIEIGLDTDPEAYGSANAYLLKLNGRLEYLLGNYQLIQYKPIREMIVNEETPYLVGVLISIDDEPIYSIPEMPRNRSQSVLSITGTTRRRNQVISSWTIERKLVIHIKSAQRIVNSDNTRVVIMCGLFHGGDPLCDHQMSSPITPNESGDGQWEEDIILDIKICDITRMARLCFSVVAIGNNSKKAKAKQTPISWANTTIFDFKNILKTGSITLSMWDFENVVEDTELELFNPLGTVVPNPNVDQTTCLTITFNKYSDGETQITFPSMSDLLKQTALNKSITDGIDENEVMDETPTHSRNTRHASKQFVEQIKEICDRDLLHKITEQERELLWFLREDCRNLLPHSLNKLLISFKWNNHKRVAQVLSFLQEWPKLVPEKALELLDYAYADCWVRKFAIECLKGITDEELSLYLLQLVQALKYESYMYCDLVHFLLERAYNNQRIGHSLFWLLRSEMHVPAVSVTFGLILEAYCRGAMDHMQILVRQTEALSKLKRVNEMIRDDKSKESRDKRIVLMQDIIGRKYYEESLLHIINPLNPIYKLGSIRINKCKFMDSKMKPLWLVFKNEDEDASDTYLIFKNGDDLRQDMLTLQMIRIMDKLWKDEGLDFRMNAYRCISTDHNVGLIEVVLNADTIANIQKEKAVSAIAAFKKESLLSWLKDHNPTEESINKSIEEFTLSCAGYCVATYILGVADRHNDNIMVTKNGQLFHIDFGHILGKFKEKFGIRRERVPFVLTNDFVYVITHGQKPERSDDFIRFQQYCEQAFMIIRKRGSFIISLFAMMLSTGIPELSSVKDLDYLRETLVLDLNEEQARNHFKSNAEEELEDIVELVVKDLDYLRETLVLDLNEEQARNHFKSKFTEALKKSWKTSLNWWAHSMAKDNKMAD
ncbi:unnamed protein product, partial [Medioppia subpectinata]